VGVGEGGRWGLGGWGGGGVGERGGGGSGGGVRGGVWLGGRGSGENVAKTPSPALVIAGNVATRRRTSLNVLKVSNKKCYRALNQTVFRVFCSRQFFLCNINPNSPLDVSFVTWACIVGSVASQQGP